MISVFKTLRDRIKQAGLRGWSLGANAAETSPGSDAVQPVREMLTLEQLEHQLSLFPEPFRMAFLPAPLEDGALMVGYDMEREMLQRQLALWQEGKPSLVAIVGKEGSGKTTLLNWLQSEAQSSNAVIRLPLDRHIREVPELLDCLTATLAEALPSSDPEELAQSLENLPEHLILVDDAHRLALQTVGVASTIRTFLQLVLATRSRHLWIVSFAEQSWRRLDYQFGLSDYFSDVIQLPAFNAEQLAATLDARLRACGCALAGTKENVENKPETVQSSEAAVSGYAQALLRISGGNMATALYYWLMYARYEDDAIKVLPFESQKLPAMGSLQPLQQFTLAQLLINAGLTVKEHAEIFQTDLRESRLILEQFCIQRLVIRKPHPAGQFLYRVNPILYNAVTEALVTANILY